MTDKTDLKNLMRLAVARDLSDPMVALALHGCHDEITALRDALDAAQSERVKPLEFEEFHLTGKFIVGYEMRLRALTVNQNYFILRRLSDGKFVVSLKVLPEEFSVYDDIEGATQSANDENQRRILSALQPTPSEWNAAIEAAAEVVRPRGEEPSVDWSNSGDISSHAAWTADNWSYLGILALKRPEHEGVE